MLLVDTGPVVAMADRRDPRNAASSDLIRGEAGPLVIPAQTTAEVDYLLRSRLGSHAGRAFLEDLAAGRFQVECLNSKDYETVTRLERQYEDLELRVADLALIVLSERFDCTRVATFDERHFRAARPLQGGSFSLLPRAD